MSTSKQVHQPTQQLDNDFNSSSNNFLSRGGLNGGLGAGGLGAGGLGTGGLSAGGLGAGGLTGGIPQTQPLPEHMQKLSNSPQDFSQKLISISISHLLFHLGFDRIQGFAMGVLVCC
jgi:hypothetical protein